MQTEMTDKISTLGEQFIKFGIDIGGTNTDGVALIGDSIVAAIKVNTTSPIAEGVKSVIKQLIERIKCSPD